MQLLVSWKNSLSLFKPSNFKVFLSDVLKSLKQTYPVWFKYWWWVMGLYLVGVATIPFFKQKWLMSFILDGSSWMTVPQIELGVLSLILFVTAFLSARSSSETKNYWYFLSYAWKFLFIDMVLSVVGRLFMLIESHLYGVGIMTGFAITIPLVICLIFLNLFFILFELDSTSYMLIKPFFYSARMVIYNLPFCIVTGFALLGLFQLTDVIVVGSIRCIGHEDIAYCAEAFTQILFVPIIACVVTIYYNMKKS
ncbi:MAG: hypothetical protein ACHQVS_02600 [Candidatus Babeliales bacterium]